MDAVLNMVKNNIIYMSKTAITGCMDKPCPQSRLAMLDTSCPSRISSKTNWNMIYMVHFPTGPTPGKRTKSGQNTKNSRFMSPQCWNKVI